MFRRLAIGAMLFAALHAIAAVVRSGSEKGESTVDASSAPNSSGEKDKEAGENPATALNPVTFRGDLSIWTAVVFVVVLLILKKFAWGPICRRLAEAREAGLPRRLRRPSERTTRPGRLLAEYEKKLAAAQDEVRGLIEQGRRDAEKVGQQLLDKAREEAGIERQRAVQQIESATLAALKGVGRAQRHLGR